MKLYAFVFNHAVNTEALKEDGYTVIDMTGKCPEGFYYMEVYYYSEDDSPEKAVPKYLKLSNIDRRQDTIMDLETGVVGVECDEDIKSKLHRVSNDKNDEQIGRISNRPILMLTAVMPHGMVNRTYTEHSRGLLVSGNVDNPLIADEMEVTMMKAIVALMPEEAAAFRTIH